MNNLLRPILLGLALLTVASVSSASAQEVELRFEDYEERLNAVLKTRRDEEKEFLKKVVARIKDGTIPERLIETSYKWVLNKRPDTDYPFIYFERVLRLQAKRLRMERDIPPFDYDIYKRRVPTFR